MDDITHHVTYRQKGDARKYMTKTIERNTADEISVKALDGRVRVSAERTAPFHTNRSRF